MRTEQMNDFEKDLADLINRHSLEGRSDTPDYLLAQYLTECLRNFGLIVKLRDIWKDRE